MRYHVETIGDRKAVADRLQTLSAKVEQVPADSKSLDEIREVLNGQWSFARTYACTTLGALGSKARPAIPDLIDALHCGDPFVEREAARALGSVAVDDPTAVPALIEKLADEDRDTAWFSAESLGNIGRPAVIAIPALEKAAMGSRATTNFSRDLMVNAAKTALEKLSKFQSQCGSTVDGGSDLDQTDASN